MVDRRTLLAGIAMSGPAISPAGAEGTDAFGFSFQAIEGGPLPLAQFRGRVLLVANTASFCGYTPQYAALQRLHDRYEARGLTVVGVPSNDFNQESTDAQKIREGLTKVRNGSVSYARYWLVKSVSPPCRGTCTARSAVYVGGRLT